MDLPPQFTQHEQYSELQNLQERHLRIMDLLLGGMSKAQIADQIGMSRQAICGITGSPLFQDELARRRSKIEKKVDEGIVNTPQRARQILEEAATDAAESLAHLSRMAENEGVRRAAASDLLDRVHVKGADARPAIIINADTINLLQQVLAEEAESDKLLEGAAA